MRAMMSSMPFGSASRASTSGAAVAAQRLDDGAVVRMQAAGQHRLLAARDALRHQHGFGAGGGAVVHGGVGDIHAGQQRDLGLELEQISAACLARSRADRACSWSGIRSAGSGDRRSPARGGDRRRRRRRTAPSRPAYCAPPAGRARARPRARLGLGQVRQARRAACRLGTSANRSSMRPTPMRGQHVAAVVGGQGEIAHQALSLTKAS